MASETVPARDGGMTVRHKTIPYIPYIPHPSIPPSLPSINPLIQSNPTQPNPIPSIHPSIRSHFGSRRAIKWLQLHDGGIDGWMDGWMAG